MALAAKKCVPCHGGMPPLPQPEVARLLAELPDWRIVEEKKLHKSFKFPDWLPTIDFVNHVGQLAEDEGHHPDLYVRWGEARVYIWTHAIDGLTENDFILAAKIDQLVESSPAAG